MKIKRMIAALTAAIMLFSVPVVVPESEGVFLISGAALDYKEYGVFTYLVSEREVKIVDCADDATGEIVVPDEIEGYPVTAIYTAFNNLDGVTSVVLPDTITYIADDAFRYCTGLTEIVIPDGVTGVPSGAFCGCSSLTSITLPSSITYISSYAFQYCTNLTSINLPISVQSVGNYAFSGCTNLAEIDIPEGTTRILEYAFYNCTGLTSLNLSSTVEVIGKRAFQDCTSLKEITLPEGLLTIESEAFRGCNLTTAHIPASVTSFAYDAFSDNSNFEGYTISEDSESYTLVDNILFSKDMKTLYKFLTKINGSYEIPEGVETIAERAFSGSNLQKVVVPASVKSIEEAALSLQAYNSSTHLYEEAHITILNPDCEIYPSKYTVYGSNGVTIYGYEGSTAQEYAGTYGYNFLPTGFERTDPVEGTDGRFNYLNYNDHIEITGPTGKGSSDIVIPETIEDRPVTEIGKKAFAGWNITSVVIPDSVTTLGEGAFYNCKKLKSVKLPATVSTIPDYCFLNCESMTECDIPEGVIWIGDYAFENTGMTTITLPSTLRNCGGWESFCYNNYLTDILVAEGNEYYSSIDGVLVQNDDSTGEPKMILVYPSGREGVYAIPEGLTVSQEAFAACKKLTSLTFPDSFSFEYFYLEFKDCNLLNEVLVSDTHPEVKSVDGVLYSKDSTEIIYVPYARKGAFVIPDTVTYVQSSAFSGNKGITEIVVPESVTEVEGFAFNAMAKLKSITFENPDCVIGGNGYTIANTYTTYSGFIYGYAGSTAEEFANTYKYKFGVLGSPSAVAGDCSNDGTFSLLDVVMFQRWILNDGTRLPNWKAVDFNADGVLDVFDLVLMKRALLNQ